jgi:hypothetical protein
MEQHSQIQGTHPAIFRLSDTQSTDISGRLFTAPNAFNPAASSRAKHYYHTFSTAPPKVRLLNPQISQLLSYTPLSDLHPILMHHNLPNMLQENLPVPKAVVHPPQAVCSNRLPKVSRIPRAQPRPVHSRTMHDGLLRAPRARACMSLQSTFFFHTSNQ